MQNFLYMVLTFTECDMLRSHDGPKV